LTILIAGAEADQEEPLDRRSHGDQCAQQLPAVPVPHPGRGRLGETVRCASPALQAEASGGDTVQTGLLVDRAALYGVPAEIDALGLELLEVQGVSVDPVTRGNHVRCWDDCSRRPAALLRLAGRTTPTCS
jgi:hypothetical protein